ncbi:ATP-dependent DNA helicase [Rubritalea tangerina]|uniref:ATP-dependent DNA helicase n=1 Tax=Rubritalea tangerina TaxID=430798 RepID=A0ABW4Z9E3_9BACT
MIAFVEGGNSPVRGLADEVEGIFSEHGLLSKSPDFAYRSQQQEMAVEVAKALEESRVLTVEAGTGVGKSLAYLIPAVKFALASGRKAVLSTHTINLQEQLTGKDIPIVRKLLGEDFDAVLLKGRQNYVCPLRLRIAMDSKGDLFTSSEVEELKEIWEWAEGTKDGTLSELDFRPSPKVWSQVCSEAHICTPRTCGTRGNCFYQKARRRVEKADVVVVNHTLFFSLLDSVMEERDERDKGYIFANDFVIFDEAHTLEDIAANQLGLRMSQSGLRFDVSRLYNPRNKKGLLKQLRSGEGIQAAEDLLERAQDFFDELAESIQFGQYSKESRVREADIVDNTLAEPLRKLWNIIENEAEKLDKESATRKELMDGARRLREMHGTLRLFLDQTDEESVYWVEKGGRDGDVLSLRSAPINVADRLREVMFGKGRTCVLTSATLSAGEEDMSYFRRRVGAEHAKAVQIGSPFDYQKQMEVYVMQAMPDPGTDKYEASLVHWIERVLKYTEGKAFVLFTSYKVMRNVADAMEDYFDEMGWRLLVQGDGTPRHKMVEIFRNDVHSVLFGTDSFWAGVDVPGEALSNVIVTRLPFSVPDHPVVQSKIEAIEAEGGNAFMDYSVPEAVIKLRQGVGRLIRSEKDKGVVVILDNRVVTKRYGKTFLKALPDAPVKVVKK